MKKMSMAVTVLLTIVLFIVNVLGFVAIAETEGAVVTVSEDLPDVAEPEMVVEPVATEETTVTEEPAATEETPATEEPAATEETPATEEPAPTEEAAPTELSSPIEDLVNVHIAGTSTFKAGDRMFVFVEVTNDWNQSMLLGVDGLDQHPEYRLCDGYETQALVPAHGIFTYGLEIPITAAHMWDHPTFYLGTVYIGNYGGHPTMDVTIHPEIEQAKCNVTIEPCMPSSASPYKIGQKIVQTWEIKNTGNVDIVAIEIERTKIKSTSDEDGYMQMEHSLDKPIAPGETAYFTTWCTANRRIDELSSRGGGISQKNEYYQEVIQFTCFEETGMHACGVGSETWGIIVDP